MDFTFRESIHNFSQKLFLLDNLHRYVTLRNRNAQKRIPGASKTSKSYHLHSAISFG